MVEEIGAPGAVLWMRLSKRSDDPEFFVYANRGRVLVLLDRGTYWQCGITIAKGSAAEIRMKGIGELCRASSRTPRSCTTAWRKYETGTM
jgi:hypothetical protein